MIGIPSPLFSNLSGSLGGITARMTPHGCVLSSRAFPIQKYTPRTNETRRGLHRANQAWTALSADDRASWDGLRRSVRTNASLKYLWGHSTRQLFLSYHTRYLQAGYTNPFTVPLATSTYRPYIRTADYTIGTGLTFDYDYDGPAFEYVYCFLYASRSFSTTQPSARNHKFIRLDWEFPVTPMLCSPQFEAALGVPKASEIISLKLIAQQAGTLPIFITSLDILAHA